MKIAFDHQIFALQTYGGISRYIVRLAQGLIALGEDVCVLAPLHRNRYLEELPNHVVHGRGFDRFPPKTSRLISFTNRQLCAMQLRKLRPDLLHETYYFAKPVQGDVAGRILTVHDMIHEKFASDFSVNDPTTKYKCFAVSRADHVICISHSTKHDLCELFDVSPEKVSVVYHGFDNFTAANDLTAFACVDNRPYLLYVGNRGGYKNFERMLRAVASCAMIKKELDVVAFGGGAFGAKEHKLILSLGFRPGAVRQIAGGDNLLATLYRGARAFVFPSLYEGFGLPPLEAMAQDCPVITSNTSSMPEVVGLAGEYFDPIDIDAQAEAIRKVVFDEKRRKQLIVAGRFRLNDFSWKRCAEETQQVYRNILQARVGI